LTGLRGGAAFSASRFRINAIDPLLDGAIAIRSPLRLAGKIGAFGHV
jgi:hypothetical protein